MLSDMKSMTTMATSLTRLGVEMPLEGSGSNHASSAHSQSGASASQSSCQKSNASSGPRSQPHKEKLANSPILSLSSKADEESSILQIGSSKDFSNSVGLAKQQLMAELREAENLMSESKTQEAAKFWRDHVLELEARLRALNGEDGSVVSLLEKQTAQTEKSTMLKSLDIASVSEEEKPFTVVPDAGVADQGAGAIGASPATSFKAISKQWSGDQTQDHAANCEAGAARAPSDD